MVGVSATASFHDALHTYAVPAPAKRADTGNLEGMQMNKFLNGALALAGLAAVALAVNTPASADGVGVGVHVGGLGIGVGVGGSDAAYGYSDGYWDHGHHWHHWRNRREMRDYEAAHHDQYHDYRHDHDGGDGWHD
jgi:hypothetical protein